MSQTPSLRSLEATPDDDLRGLPGLEDDAEGTRIVREELKLLATVFRALDAGGKPGAAAARARALDDERLLELRDDVAVAKPEDLPALFEQMHNLGALRAQRGRSVAGSIDRATPYFGHMRLEESVAEDGRTDRRRDGAGGLRGDGPVGHGLRGPGRPVTRRRDVLIGARSYVDSGEGIRIVDWRQAPVSRLYYRYVEGDDYEEELGGSVVEGVVVARRSVSIVGGALVRVSAPAGTFVLGKDGAWRRVGTQQARLETEGQWAARHGVAAEARLGGSETPLQRDKHLPAIAALLDEKQFNLIAGASGSDGANDGAGLVAIQGSAGSGKTTVGLHRVAYLAFRDPHRFRPEKMLVVVPNEALIHYVSRVLPSLGVEGVAVTTFARFASRLVGQLFPRLPARTSDETPPAVTRAKSHPAMLRAIDRAAARITRDVDARLRAAMAKWPEGASAAAAWSATQSDGTLAVDARLSLLGQWLAGKRQLGGGPAGAVPSSGGLPQVTRSALEQALNEARRQSRAVVALWDELLTSREALAETFAGEPSLGTARLDQVHAWCVRQARVRAEGERDGEQPSVDVEDFALLLRCWQALRGPLVDPEAKPIRFAHLFVDEVQDAAPVELRVLLELTGKERCVTLAGDVAQRMLEEGDDRGEFDWNALLDGLGVSHTTLEPLKVSYRSTAEITTFARAVLGPLAHDDEPATTRHGPPVELFTFASVGETVAWLADVLKQLALDERDANVALVARFPQQADLYFDGLSRAEIPNLRRVAKQDFSWEPGVDVTDVRQTKGLEFDEVLLIEASAASYPETPQARHAMYVAATRATHQLWCVSSDAPSKLVTAAVEPATPPESG